MAGDMFEEGRSEKSLARRGARGQKQPMDRTNPIQNPTKKLKKKFVTKAPSSRKVTPNQGLGPSARGIEASMGKAGGKGRFGNVGARIGAVAGRGSARGKAPIDIGGMGNQVGSAFMKPPNQRFRPAARRGGITGAGGAIGGMFGF